MKAYLQILLSLLLLNSCVKEKISSNPGSWTLEYSIPLGELTGKFQFPVIQADSLHPGPYGFINIDGSLYPNPDNFYASKDRKQLDFENTITKTDSILSLTIRLIITNSYPTEAYAQVYFLGLSGIRLDSLMSKGMQRIDPGNYTDDHQLIRTSISLYTIPLTVSQIHVLTTCNEIAIEGLIASTRGDGKTVYFKSDQELVFDMGMRIQLKMN